MIATSFNLTTETPAFVFGSTTENYMGQGIGVMRRRLHRWCRRLEKQSQELRMLWLLLLLLAIERFLMGV